MTDDPPGLTVAAVARRLGVAPATVRSWERRYGVGPTGHVSGSRRSYGPNDLNRLEQMRRLTLDGVTPADAARAVLRGPPLAAARSMGLPSATGRLLAIDDRAGRPGGPGGRVLAVPGAEAAARGLSRAAMALDAAAVRRLVRDEIRASGVLATWERVVVPVLQAVGDRWAVTGEGVEVEHVLAESVQDALRASAPEVDSPQHSRPVLLACTPAERHALPLYALSAALAERAVSAWVLGAAVPGPALAAAVRRTGPAALFLWCQRPATGGVAYIEELPGTRPPTAVILGGPGWGDPAGLPSRATYAYDLGDAVHLVQVAVGAG